MDIHTHFKDLKENGYIFTLNKMGRLGNLLIQMENVLLLAKNTQSIVKYPKRHNIINIPVSKEIDFRSSKNNNCGRIIKRSFLRKSPYMEHLFIDADKWCLNYLHNAIKQQEPTSTIDENTLVIHIRSGDIMKPGGGHTEFYQPPLSYYQHIIKHNNYSDILIVTEPDKMNPVINGLLSWDARIRISDCNYLSDISSILKSTHLVASRSTFSKQLSRLSKNLKVLYMWKDKKHYKWDEWQPTSINCLSNNIKLTKYSAETYIKIGEWKRSNEQLNLIMNYPMEKLTYEQK